MMVDFIAHLPQELVIKVVSYLDLKDTLRCRAVSTRWRETLDHLDRYWLNACEQFGFPTHVVEEYSCGVGLQSLVLAGLRHRQWVASRRPKSGNFAASSLNDRRCNVHRFGLFRKSLGIINDTSCLIGNGCVLCIDSTLKSGTSLLVKKVCPESKALIAINALELTPYQRQPAVIWAKATSDYILFLVASGRWYGYCTVAKRIVLKWDGLQKGTILRADGSLLHILVCDKCFMVVTASSFSSDSPLWEVLVLKLGKGDSTPGVVSQRTLLIPIQPKERLVQWYLYPSSQSCDEDNYCLTHKLVCHNDASIVAFDLDHAQTELKVIAKTAEVHMPSCQCFTLDEDTQLPQTYTSCLSADCMLLGGVVKPCHLFVWDTSSWRVLASVDLQWMQRLGGIETLQSQLLAVGHLYSVLAVVTATKKVKGIFILSTRTGDVVNGSGSQLFSVVPSQAFPAAGPIQMNLVNEDWLSNVHCFNAPFLVWLLPNTPLYSLISYVQFQDAPRGIFSIFS